MTNMPPKRHASVRRRALAVLLTLCVGSAACNAQPICDVPALSDVDVKSAIDAARADRADLPPTFPDYRWSVKQRGCYYVYIEFQLPEAADANHMITLNQHGAIVDVRARGRTSELECPSNEFTDDELAEIVRAERKKRADLPPPFDDFRPQVERLRCLYLYFEHRVPEQRGDYHVFTIDPFGELMEFSRSKPYREVVN